MSRLSDCIDLTGDSADSSPSQHRAQSNYSSPSSSASSSAVDPDFRHRDDFTYSNVDCIPIHQSRVPNSLVSNVYGQALSDTIYHSANSPIETLVLGNYEISIPFLARAIPNFSSIPQIHLIHGNRDPTRLLTESREFHHQIQLISAPLPIPFGVHHSKFAFIFYSTGFRFSLFTANFIEIDWLFKNQLLFSQDFPYKSINNKNQMNQNQSNNPFENDLISYISQYPSMNSIIDRIRLVDFSSARFSLVASAPGYWKGADLNKFGHLRLRALLNSTRKQIQQKQQSTSSSSSVASIFTPASAFIAAAHSISTAGSSRRPMVICQYSSCGSVSDNWLNEFLASLSIISPDCVSSSSGPNAILTSRPELKLIWPTLENVRNSMEGYSAGGSLCFDSKNCRSPVNDYFHRWESNSSFPADLARARCMPHQKSYLFRSATGEIQYFLISSANLSSAAWGAIQKSGTQFMIRHYELGLLFEPKAFQTISSDEFAFSCTPDRPLKLTGGRMRSAAEQKQSQQQQQQPKSNSSVRPKKVEFVLLRQPLLKSENSSSSNSIASQQRVGEKRIRSAGESSNEMMKREKLDEKSESTSNSNNSNSKTPSISSNNSVDSDSIRVMFPMPYSIHSDRYSSTDIPWVWDQNYPEIDVHGFSFRPNAAEED